MEKAPPRKNQIRWQNCIKHMLLILLCLFALFPIYWMAISSLRPTQDIFSASLFPSAITFDNYRYASKALNIVPMIMNTFLIAFCQSALQLMTGVLAAYSLTRWEFKGSQIIYAFFSLTWLVPFQAIMIPNYISIVQLGLHNSVMGVIMPNMASAFAILSLYPAFKSFPKALIEAAVMDRMSPFGVLFKLILPNLKSAIFSLGILLFINSWNEYFWPALVFNNMDQAPLQIGIRTFMSIETTSWGALMAAAMISSLPILLLYLAIQKQIIQSFVKWGIK